MMKDEEWMMKDDDFKLLRGFDYGWTDGQTNRRTDICECRVAFATEKFISTFHSPKSGLSVKSDWNLYTKSHFIFEDDSDTRIRVAHNICKWIMEDFQKKSKNIERNN